MGFFLALLGVSLPLSAPPLGFWRRHSIFVVRQLLFAFGFQPSASGFAILPLGFHLLGSGFQPFGVGFALLGSGMSYLSTARPFAASSAVYCRRQPRNSTPINCPSHFPTMVTVWPLLRPLSSDLCSSANIHCTDMN